MKKPKNRKPFLFKITNRSILFLFSLSLVLFFFYGAGNIQRFSEQSLKFLLNAVSILSASLLVFIVAGLAQILWYGIKLKTLQFLGFAFLYLVFAFFSVLFILFASGVIFLSK
ncbi:hypothetical protein V1L52_05915 [Treponema sp. HNW]|uniref:hypothetical protein n=1 Tax=Treponema sp. HNW TaxID=3116654 RepID=UPI003D097836